MNKSESIKELATALAKFQAEVNNPKNTADNPFYKSKYAPLNDILADVRPLLSKYGLSVLQHPGGDGSNISISTIIMHSSGEWIEPEPLVLKAVKSDPQGAGSAITYGRRYALSAALGISSEDDDDGQCAAKTTVKDNKPQPTQKPSTAGSKPVEIASEEQRKKLFATSKEAGAKPEDVKALIAEKFELDSTSKLTKPQCSQLIDYYEKQKLAQGATA